MSRLSNYREEDKTMIEEGEFDDGFASLEIPLEPKQSKVVLWDFDSVIYFTLISGKNPETGIPNPPFELKDLEYLQGKLTEFTLKILNEIESKFNILALYIFIKGKEKNFRKEIYPEYKANRGIPHELVPYLYEYAKIAHGALEAESGVEAEDMVFSLSKKIDHNGLIVFIDHDLDEAPSLRFNYKSLKYSKISEKEAKFNLIKKICLSEPGDNVKTSPGIGVKYFEKNFHIDMTDEEFQTALKAAYLKAWKGDLIKATEQLNIAKQILPLKDINDLLLTKEFEELENLSK